MANALYPGNPFLKTDEIRLVRLLPGLWGDDIRCELVHSPLQTAPPYHALSYVWGARKITRPILLDGHVFPATINLESALRHLRCQLEETLLWVDALCINQADNQERTHQVQLMGRIYSSCKSVLVYLGDGIGCDKPQGRLKATQSAPPKTVFSDDDKDIPQIERFLQAASDSKHVSMKRKRAGSDMQETVKVFSFIRSLSWVNHLADLPMFASENGREIQGDVLTLFESLRQLMHAPFTPWWGRIWVVQEVILPRKVTVICGAVSAPWRMFAQAASRYLHHIHNCCTKYPKNLSRDYTHVLKDLCQRVLDIEDLRSTYVQHSINTEYEKGGSIMPKISDSKPEQKSLLSLLRRFRSRQASDPRDKVYALLSLVQQSSDQRAIRPRYGISVQDVFIEATLECIYSSGSLSVLNADLTRKFRQDLPSWVPDWESPGDFTHNPRVDAIEMYDLCSNEPVNPTTVIAVRDRLVLYGRYVDEVVKTGEVMLSDSPDAIRETLMSWFEIYVQRNILKTNTAMVLDQDLWRVFCADLLCYPPTSNRRGTFERTDLNSELMFVTWALLSEKSPFQNDVSSLKIYLSSTAQTWSYILDFETSILTGATNQAAVNFEMLFPNKEERRCLILLAYESAGIKAEEQENTRELIDCATMTDYELKESYKLDYMRTQGGQVTLVTRAGIEAEKTGPTRSVAKGKRFRARQKVPWSQVLNLARPGLLDRLGTAALIGAMSKDIQVSIMDYSIASATNARRLFLTKNGYIGLGPADSTEGDKLFLLRGGKTPFLLRRSNQTDRPNSVGCLKVIGDCYACGLTYSDTLKKHLIETPSRQWKKIVLV